jgi:hypothetical protein
MGTAIACLVVVGSLTAWHFADHSPSLRQPTELWWQLQFVTLFVNLPCLTAPIDVPSE